MTGDKRKIGFTLLFPAPYHILTLTVITLQFLFSLHCFGLTSACLPQSLSLSKLLWPPFWGSISPTVCVSRPPPSHPVHCQFHKHDNQWIYNSLHQVSNVQIQSPQIKLHLDGLPTPETKYLQNECIIFTLKASSYPLQSPLNSLCSFFHPCFLLHQLNPFLMDMVLRWPQMNHAHVESPPLSGVKSDACF